jgi:hypothetical protein
MIPHPDPGLRIDFDPYVRIAVRPRIAANLRAVARFYQQCLSHAAEIAKAGRWRLTTQLLSGTSSIGAT